MEHGDVADVVIVGAGPAGCVLASRLSEAPTRHVLLLEAGPDYGSDPAGWPVELCNPLGVPAESHSWGYAEADRPPDRPLLLPRGRVVGGTSAINACAWIRGSATDYDEWAALGNPGWSFADLLPHFRRAERDPLGGPLHGTGGPVPVTRAAPDAWTPVDHALVAAAEALGFPFVTDLNGTASQYPAVGPTPKNVADGVRMNAAFTYLAPARQRPNLTIIPNALVDRVVLDHGRAVAVRIADGRVIAGQEIILCAGAYGSPAILLRSGIGPADHLHDLGIPIIAERPGVGEHLLDHPLVTDLMECAIVPGHEPPTTTFTPITIKARSRQASAEIDLHIYQGQSFDPDLGGWTFWLSVSLQHASSRGRLRLTSPDPSAPLAIHHAHLSDPGDLEGLCDGVELVNHVVKTPPLATTVTPIPERTLAWRNRDELRVKVRNQVGTTFHPSSTCRMGPEGDPTAVVDQEGRVHGVAGLRVVDASIFPTGPRGNLHFPIVAIAEKLAETIGQA